MSEFELIRKYFSHTVEERTDVVLGVGDDCALLQPPQGCQLAVSIDTLVEGVHFFPDIDPFLLGHKALAVNLSDLAAMGARPAWVTLALALPDSDPRWLQGFSQGFAALAHIHNVQLVGGDTTRGPLTITAQVHGFIEPEKALRRDAASVDDLVYVTGTLGDAGLALRMIQGSVSADDYLPSLRDRLERPQPRIAEGLAVKGLARGGIDISDGLISDLGHICRASDLGAKLFLDQVPLSEGVGRYINQGGDWGVPLASGDDYELCLTVPAENKDEFEARMQDTGIPFTLVGTMEQELGIRCQLPGGGLLDPLPGGYEHFSHE
ncbi:thiamine-phosphate kinase [Solemya velesiana gill symbiont]|uniref:Thiamine-monophosphate kinase n=1 Tax=Solemya velesiana gill symbiont TaxID=1918948 RepID=A0A1T2KVK6_9GAMM|nr:thiamine-phosphate kinase [Solemya velesiana gill symbiont]